MHAARHGQIVRIAGDPDSWEVFCETDTTMVLVNRAAKARKELAVLERKLQVLRREIEDAQARR
jgi:hypothetical protein